MEKKDKKKAFKLYVEAMQKDPDYQDSFDCFKKLVDKCDSSELSDAVYCIKRFALKQLTHKQGNQCLEYAKKKQGKKAVTPEEKARECYDDGNDLISCGRHYSEALQCYK